MNIGFYLVAMMLKVLTVLAVGGIHKLINYTVHHSP
jgi:hypothetical protein